MALYVDDSGGIKPERVASEAVPLRLGGNPVLTDLMLGSHQAAVATTTEPTFEPLPAQKKGPHPGGVVALIIGGLLGGAAAGVGIWAGTRPDPEPAGVLVVELP